MLRLMPFLSPLLGPLFSSDAIRRVLADGPRLQRRLNVEAARAGAEAAVGVIPQAAATAIAAACRADRYELNRLGEAAVNAGNLAIPLVKVLTAAVAETDKD